MRNDRPRCVTPAAGQGRSGRPNDNATRTTHYDPNTTKPNNPRSLRAHKRFVSYQSDRPHKKPTCARTTAVLCTHHTGRHTLNIVVRTNTPACVLPCYCTVAIPQKSVRTQDIRCRLHIGWHSTRDKDKTRDTTRGKLQHAHTYATKRDGLYNKTGCREHTSPLPAIQHRWKGDKEAACGPVRKRKALANTRRPHEGTFRAATSQAAVVGVPRVLAHQQGPQQETGHLWALTDGCHARTPKR